MPKRVIVIGLVVVAVVGCLGGTILLMHLAGSLDFSHLHGAMRALAPLAI
jgi:hypothetical protein